MKIGIISLVLIFIVSDTKNYQQNLCCDNNDSCKELFERKKQSIKYEHDKNLMSSHELNYENLSQFLKCSIQLANEGDEDALRIAKNIYSQMADGMQYGELGFNTELVYKMVYNSLKELADMEDVVEISLQLIEANRCSYDFYEKLGAEIDLSTVDSPYTNYSLDLFYNLIYPNLGGTSVNKYVDLMIEDQRRRYAEGTLNEDICSKKIVQNLYPILKKDFEEGKLIYRSDN